MPEIYDFYPRPPGGGRRLIIFYPVFYGFYFYPRPPGGGRLAKRLSFASGSSFLSTPSGWRATQCADGVADQGCISIHALRVEGDEPWMIPSEQFSVISIHALRVEGDKREAELETAINISIHALRVEGDRDIKSLYEKIKISIHALRVEGDHDHAGREEHRTDFYPRPPGGGRLLGVAPAELLDVISIHALRVEGDEDEESEIIRMESFLSTPSGWRATGSYSHKHGGQYISIHALRVEGDSRLLQISSWVPYFYPRPPGGGRQQKRTKFSSVFAQKGEEIASLRRGKRKFAGGVLKRTNFGF